MASERSDRRHPHLRARVRDHRRFWASPRTAAANSWPRAFPSWMTVPDNQWLAMARRWHLFFAWLFVINGLATWPTRLRAAICARSRADAAGLAHDRPVDRRSPEVQASDRRSGQALQRPAEARLSGRDLRAAAADHPDGPGDVAVARRALAGLGRPVRRATVGADDPFHRRVAAGRVRPDPCLRSDRQRLLEPPALDDHRPLPDRTTEAAHEATLELVAAAVLPGTLRRGRERVLLAGCEKLSQTEWFPKLLGAGEEPQPEQCTASLAAQGDGAGILAPPICRRIFAATARPSRTTRQYMAHGRERLCRLSARRSTGLVEQPADVHARQLRALPSRTQITRHDCVEGWSAIGKWKGVKLSALLDAVQAEARGALRRLPLRRPDGSQTARARTTKASTWMTRITRRRSSPTS